METVYQWVKGSCMKGDANEAGRVCAELERQGKLTAEELVNVSRDKKSPLHGMFEWDDAVAAEKYRKVQAYKIIRSVEVVIEDNPTPQRAFYTTENKVYRSTDNLMSSDETRRLLLKVALSELQAFKRKYSRLTELSKVFEAIDMI